MSLYAVQVRGPRFTRQGTVAVVAIGYIWRGKVVRRRNAQWYPSPSAAEAAITAYRAKHPSHRCKLVPHP